MMMMSMKGARARVAMLKSMVCAFLGKEHVSKRHPRRFSDVARELARELWRKLQVPKLWRLSPTGGAGYETL